MIEHVIQGFGTAIGGAFVVGFLHAKIVPVWTQEGYPPTRTTGRSHPTGGTMGFKVDHKGSRRATRISLRQWFALMPDPYHQMKYQPFLDRVLFVRLRWKWVKKKDPTRLPPEWWGQENDK